MQISNQPLTTTIFISADHQHDLLKFKPSIRIRKKSDLSDIEHSKVSCDGYFQQHSKAQIISNWFLEKDNESSVLRWPPESPDLNPLEHIWDVVEWVTV